MARTLLLKRYDLLRDSGHTPDKALEIAIDAKRRDDHARRWLTSLWRARRSQLREAG